MQDNTGSARAYAWQVLNKIEGEGSFAGLAEEEEQRSRLDARDERFAYELVAGVTRWLRRLDYLIVHYYHGRQELEPEVRQVLRIALYEILFLDTAPHAAVNEAVELTRQEVTPRASGLVNGMLRTVLREKDTLPEPDGADAVTRLGILYSHPDWLVKRWVDRFGAETTERLLIANNRRPVYGLRFNRMRLTREAFTERLAAAGAEWEPGRYLDDYVRLQRLQSVLASGMLRDGSCAVQDESAGLVVRLLNPGPNDVVVDACSAPGGKARYAAELMQNRGRVLACDLHANRLRLVRHNASNAGLTIIETRVGDFRRLAGAIQKEEVPVTHILIDAPCSGLGVLSKRADLRWRKTEQDLADLLKLQDQLLDAAAPLLKPGGVLVYATCTIEPDENVLRIRSFLERHPEYQLQPADTILPSEVVSPEGFMSTFPQTHGVDGAFGARLVRR